MDRERWNHVDRLLQSALDRPPADRDVFLRRACGDDPALVLAVRSLVAAHDPAEKFLGVPAVDVAARQFTSSKRRR